MVENAGGVFDRRDELEARLKQGPGEEARQAAGLSLEAPPPSRWTLSTIRATFPWLTHYSLSGVWNVLQRSGLELRSARVQMYSPDPAYADKLAHLLTCLHEAALSPSKVTLLFMDEMGFYRWPSPGTDWMPAAPQPVQVAACADNNRQWRIVGVLNALTGQANYLDNYIVGRKQLIAMYQQIDTLYPDAHCVYVVQDNWSIHSHDDVLSALSSVPRIQPVWLPTYSPWLNPIEKLWRWLRQSVLRLHRLAADWSTLLAHVHAFLDQFSLGSQDLLRYVGLLGDGQLAQALRLP